MFGSTLSADETIRKSSSLPAYARHGFSFGLGRLRRSNKKSSSSSSKDARQPRSASSSSSSSSSSDIDDATVHAPSPIKSGMGWERTKREEGRGPRPLSFETKVLVQETVFESPNVRNASAKTTVIERTQNQPPARRWKETSGMSKKERREQLKARVEALRERLRDSSSDDDTPTGSSNSSLNNTSTKGARLHKVHSDDALHRPRLPRTERGNARRKSQATNDLYVNTTPTVPRRYIQGIANDIVMGNGVQTPSRQWNNSGNSIKKEAPSNKSQTSVVNGYYQQTEKRPSSPYPCISTPPIVKAAPRAPTPPPRSPKTLTPFFQGESNGSNILPPPPPMRHSHSHPRPASYSFENTHPFLTKGPIRARESYKSTSPPVDQETSSGVFSYTDETSSLMNRSKTASSSYLSDSHTTSLHRSATDVRNFNSTPKPWSPKGGSAPIVDKPPSSKPNNLRGTTSTTPTPPVPPRRCSLHILPGSSSNDTNKSPNNLEDALQELERIYQSLKLKDEGLLDRAERRELLTSPYINGVASKAKTTSELHLDKKETNTEEERPLRSKGLNDVSNLNKLNKLNVSGSYDSLVSDMYKRNRGPKLSDDLAYRRLQRPSVGRPANGSLMGSSTPTASYLLLSPALSPAVSADDVTKSGRGTSLSNLSIGRTPHQPDTVRDDVLFRSIRDANGQKPPEPQPPFGIPVGVVTPAPASDYLHAPEIGKPAKTRPTFQPRFYPDILQDDMAYRALRKDRSPPPSTRATVGIGTTTPTTSTINITNNKTSVTNDDNWVLNSIVNDSDDNGPPMSSMVSSGLSKIRTSSSSLLSVGGPLDVSTSTETLTESPAKEPSSEIWQVRVTLHPAATDDDGPPTIASSVVSPVATTFGSTIKTNPVKSCARATNTPTPTPLSSRNFRSDDEALPAWRKASTDAASRAYRPSQHLRSARQSHLLGSATASGQRSSSMASGTVSDSDMRRRGSPMDEGRLDELLRSLTQGTSNLSSQESHDEEPESVPSQG